MFPALDLLRDGYEVYTVSDSSGGTSVDAHERGMQRLVQAGTLDVGRDEPPPAVVVGGAHRAGRPQRAAAYDREAVLHR